MKRHIYLLAAAMTAALAAPAAAQFDVDDVNYHITAPSFDVRFSTGFNYDLLRSPTDVSFRYPVGYFGFNVPLGRGGNLQTIPILDGVMDELFDESGQFRRGENFKPNGGVSQNANYTVRVDVPMLYGVGTFGYTQNFFLNFSTAIGGTSVLSAFMPIEETLSEGDADISMNGYFALRGALRIPLALSLGWETMTFGYAYRVADNDDLIFALNLHYHLFSFDLRAKADVDLLGHLNLNANARMSQGGVTLDMPLINTATDLIDFNSDMATGSATGRYRAEVVTPSVGVKLWRFKYDGRFGMNVKARGSLSGGFKMPKIVDLETGDFSQEYNDLIDDLENDQMKILNRISNDGIESLITSELDSIEYRATSPLVWKMPDGHTFSFDLVRDKMTLSYTKLFGEVAMKLNDLRRVTTDSETEEEALIDVNFGVMVDHIIMLHFKFPSVFFNLGVFGMDVRAGTAKYILGDIYKDVGLPRMGRMAMFPVLNGGVTLGSKLQLQIEADLLPLPAVRTGIHYYF